MLLKAETNRRDVTLLVLALLGTGCGAATKALPARPPELPGLQETGAEAAWPPEVKGATNVQIVPWSPVPGSLTDGLEAQMRQAALQDARVRRELGARFAFLGVDEIEAPKDRARRPSDPVPARVHFFSYANNVAVEATMAGARVESAARREGYQPPEGPEEVVAAVALAQRDPRLAERVQGLRGVGILAFPPDQGEARGHRVLHVSFIAGDEDLPRYMALVDLTAERVLDAGPVERRR